MTAAPSDGPVGKIIETLRERAKELQCLYQVHELTSDPDRSLEEVCGGLLDVLPPGWQYPAACFARLSIEGASWGPAGPCEAVSVQRASIVVQGEAVGFIEVCYSRPLPKADEGPFLKEERKLIDTVAQRVGHFLMQRRVRGALSNWKTAIDTLESREKREWWAIVEFLRKTDPHLMGGISRRMINYLCWNGIAEAQELLQSLGVHSPAVGDDDNRPQERASSDAFRRVANEAFRIAADHLGEAEIISCVEKWIKDDKAAFLVEAVENQTTSLRDIAEALDRYKQMAIEDHELSRSVQIGLRVSLARRFLSEDLGFINTAKNYLGVTDFHDLVQRVISPSASRGRLGGKSSGLLLSSHIVRKSREYADALGHIKAPTTWYIASDGLLSFIEYNHLQDIHNRKYLEIDQIRREYPHIVQAFKNSHFPPELHKGLSLALDDLGDQPLIVRSSSLLEDRIGAAFSGKYKSLFLANHGTRHERLVALMDAVAEVYASIFAPDPIQYRAERGLLDVHEEMGVMIQSVVGARVGHYVFPAFAGVAFSHNEFRWSPRIRRDDGLVRMVTGLGTRAVDRLSDDFPVLMAPGQPGLRVNVTPEEALRYSPRKIDVIDCSANSFRTVLIADLLRECGREFPLLGQIFSVYDRDGIHRAPGFDWDPARDALIVTFDGLVRQTPFMVQMQALLRLLRDSIGMPVDIEFASDGRDFYLLQCRPQSFSDQDGPAPIPKDVPEHRVLFTANRFVSNGWMPDISHIVYVDPERYAQLGDLNALRDVGRAIGRLNRVLPKRQFILMGPGRWGSRGDIKLGVSVTYSDINNTAMLMEIATSQGEYSPELSFGTHFFQDLVEASIRYLPLYPDEGDTMLNRAFLRSSANILRDLLPEYGHLADVVRVIDVPKSADGQVLRVRMNADLDEAIGMLCQPGSSVSAGARTHRDPDQTPDTHWRWRLRMAEQLASELDGGRFGVRAMYIFGSTKNATAGPASDIDLLIHFAGSPEQRRALDLWLEGWSLCLAEINFVRTGYHSDGLLDVHVVTDDDIAEQTSFAAKINAVTDPARPLALATHGQASRAPAEVR
jgi:hypothetical protein